MEADGKSQNGDQGKFTPSSASTEVEDRSLFKSPGGGCGGSTAITVRERCMTFDYVPSNVGNVAKSEGYGPP